MSGKDLPFQYDIGRRSNYVGRGQETQVENIQAYICQPPFPTDKAVIVVHDIYGWQFPDTRYMADIIAAEGYLIICPDFFLGKAPWTPDDRWKDFADWLKHRDPMEVDKSAEIVMKCLKQQYNVKEIGIVGFSWGGMAVHHLMLTNPELKTGVSAYGIIRDTENRYNLLNPTFFIFGEKDHTISEGQECGKIVIRDTGKRLKDTSFTFLKVTLLEQKLKEYCRVDYKVKVYPGQVHGFAQCKPEDMKPKDVPYIEEARVDMLEWLNRYLLL